MGVKRVLQSDTIICYPLTGRQLPPLSSVLYGIISGRHSVLAAQLLLREKSGAKRNGTDSNILKS